MTALPALRPDLKLSPGPTGPDGAPTWTVYDPARHRYFSIGAEGFAILSLWESSGDTDTLLAAAPSISAADLEVFILFLASNHLLVAASRAAISALAETAAKSKPDPLSWLIHNYLFVRIPLVRPDAFLAATLHLAKPFLSAQFGILIAVLAALGLYLTGRQWDAFLATFSDFASPSGAVAFALTLALVKSAHELGHAYVAKRYDCTVPTMGLALMVLFPVLYTETSDAYRLTDRRQRLHIAAAGILTELSLAALATLVWNFLPDGPARSAAFLIATTTWITSLAVNASPFMRFDGYYLLSDALGIPNLQARSFALARHALRLNLFGCQTPAPEVFAPKLRAVLIAYAFATWLYRLILFTGIAALVYSFAFKALGLILFAIEIGYFIALPIARELITWTALPHKINRQTIRTLALFGALFFLAVVPWQSSVSVPTVWRAADYAAIYPPCPARLMAVQVNPGQLVQRGDALFTLASPDLDAKLTVARAKARAAQIQLDRAAADDSARAASASATAQLAASDAEIGGITRQQARLTVRAPMAGVVRDMPADLHPGDWLKADQPLGLIVSSLNPAAVGYVAGSDTERLLPSAAGVFIPADPARSAIPVRLDAIASVNAATLDIPALATVYGGPIAIATTAPGKPLTPTAAIYRVNFSSVGAGLDAPSQTIVGAVHLAADARSLLSRAITAVAAICVRESGF